MRDADALEEFGPFRVYEQLGAGGVATVHRAEMRTIDGFRRAVALKRLLPHLVADREIVDAFVREARLASHMQHANIAQTYELGKVGKTYFISMELVPGPTLDQIMRHSQAVAGAIPIPVTLGILIQICDALDYAHNLTDQTGTPLGIIHRDISPPNVIVSNTGIVKLVDFGIAKLRNRTNLNSTGQGVIKGRSNYVAPEYLQGHLDTRADLFAVGVIAHELLTGRRLFEGADDFETATRVLNMPIQPPSRWALAVPRDLDDIVLTALARDPRERWQTASAMRNALASAARSANAHADHAQILAWVQWAFSQKVRPEAPIEDVIDTLGEPSTALGVISPEQQRILEDLEPPRDRFADPPGVSKETVGYAGVPAIPSMLPRSKPSSTSPPLIVPAKPLQQKPQRRLGAMTPAAGEPSPDEPEPREKGGGRFVLYAFLVLLAGAGGVAAAMYLVEYMG